MWCDDVRIEKEKTFRLDTLTFVWLHIFWVHVYKKYLLMLWKAKNYVFLRLWHWKEDFIHLNIDFTIKSPFISIFFRENLSKSLKSYITHVNTTKQLHQHTKKWGQWNKNQVQGQFRAQHDNMLIERLKIEIGPQALFTLQRKMKRWKKKLPLLVWKWKIPWYE